MKKIFIKSIVAIIAVAMICYIGFCTYRDWSVMISWYDRICYLCADTLALMLIIIFGKGFVILFEQD